MHTGTIDAKPFRFALGPRFPALVIIDMQRDFVEAGGFGASLGNDVRLLQKIIPTVANVLSVCRRLGLPIVHTREAHRSDLSDCPPAKRMRGNPGLRIGDPGPMGRLLVDGEPGSSIVPELAPLPGEIDLVKPGKGAFYSTPLQMLLQQSNINQLLIAGVTTEVCVQTTMREANDRGFECVLIEDATESYFPEFKRATLDMITAQGGIVGWTASSKNVISALEHTYGRVR